MQGFAEVVYTPDWKKAVQREHHWMDLFRRYVENDLVSADADYVLEVLRGECGMETEEIEELGFGYLIPEEPEYNLIKELWNREEEDQ